MNLTTHPLFLLFIILASINSYTYKVKLNLLAYHPNESVGTFLANGFYSVSTLNDGRAHPSTIQIVSSRDKIYAVKQFKTIVRSTILPHVAPRRFNFFPKKQSSEKAQVEIIGGGTKTLSSGINFTEHFLTFDFATTLCVLNLEVTSRVSKGEVLIDVFVSCVNEEAYDEKSGKPANSNELSTMFRVNDKLY